MKDTCLLSGGGYDSLSVALWLHRNRKPFDLLHVDYGQVAASQELGANRRIAKALRAPLWQMTTVLPLAHGVSTPEALSTLLGGRDPNPEIPGRNTHLVNLAAAQYRHVYLGLDMPVGREPFADCSEQWLDQVGGLMRSTYQHFEGAYAPYLHVPKVLAFLEAVDYAKHLGLDFWDLGMTCWFPLPDGKTCGQCRHCHAARDLRQEIENGKD